MCKHLLRPSALLSLCTFVSGYFYGPESFNSTNSSTRRLGCEWSEFRHKVSCTSSSGKEPQKGPALAHISLIGERNTGTNWMVTVLKDNFDVKVTDRFCRFKHWAQPANCHLSSISSPYAVVLIIRNPYDWAASFYTKPYNSPLHCCREKGLSFSTFLRKPWALNTEGRGSDFKYSAFFEKTLRVAHDQVVYS